MNKEEVLKLAKLARIAIKDEEAANLGHEFETILNYVGEIKKAEGEEVETNTKQFSLSNVLREDVPSNASTDYRKEILANAPSTDGDYIKVKNIL